MEQKEFDAWCETVVSTVKRLVHDHEPRFKCWLRLAESKKKWGASKQFQNEVWFQSELAFYLLRDNSDEIEVLPEVHKSGIDYDLFIIPRQDVPEGKGGIERVFPFGLGLELKNWVVSYYGATLIDEALRDVKKAQWGHLAEGVASGLHRPPCLGINLVKPELLAEWNRQNGEEFQKVQTICKEKLLEKPATHLLAWSYFPK